MDLSNLKKLRCERSLLQKDIANYLGITVAAYSLYETGKRTPSIDVLKKLCKFYNIDMDLLLGWREPEQYHVIYGNPFKDKEQSLTQEELDRRLKEETAKKPPNFTDPDNNINIDPDLQKLYETAMQKAVHHDELTEEEKQVIIGISRQLRQKGDDPLSYENSYSFASSEEELDRLQNAKQIELEKKRAKPFKLYETEEDVPPKPFTRPLQSSYDKPNEDYQDNSLKLHTNTRGINWERLDDFRFDELMIKLDHGEELTPAEINFKSAYLERCLKKVGEIFAKFYSMLNVEGQKKADEQIDRAIEQVELLTKIPEYQKKPDTPPRE